MEKITVGQECYATGGSYSRPMAAPRRVVVEKIGRVYITTLGVMDDGTVQGEWTRRRFQIQGRGEVTRFGSGGRLYTPGEWAEREECESLKKALTGLGVTSTHSYGSAFSMASSDQLRAIIEILDRP